MKSILLFSLAVCLLLSQISCKHATPIEPPRYSLLSQTSMDAKANCVLLDSSNAVRANVVAGTYPLRTWGTTGKSVCVVYADANSIGLQVRTMNAGYDFPVAIGQDSIFYAFYATTTDVVDVSTQMTFDFGATRITVKAVDNSISLQDFPAAVVNIPSAGNYQISFSGSATVFERNPQTGFFYEYGNVPTDMAASWITFPTFVGPTKVYFFFVDAGTRSDNTGAITVNLYSQVN